MTVLRSARRIANRALQPLGLEVHRVPDRRRLPWDDHFERWISRAKAEGVDPNDLGDGEWHTDELDMALDVHYRPLLGQDKVIAELGPGSGRLSRHLAGRCARLILLDRSGVVCEWLRSYLAPQPGVEVHELQSMRFPIAAAICDAVVSHGVIEHLATDELYWVLNECRRVLRPDGVFVFNYDNLTDAGVAHLVATSAHDRQSEFRFYTSDAIEALAKATGFRAAVFEGSGRVSFARLTPR